jgi:hypothetical protein
MAHGRLQAVDLPDLTAAGDGANGEPEQIALAIDADQSTGTSFSQMVRNSMVRDAMAMPRHNAPCLAPQSNCRP